MKNPLQLNPKARTFKLKPHILTGLRGIAVVIAEDGQHEGRCPVIGGLVQRQQAPVRNERPQLGMAEELLLGPPGGRAHVRRQVLDLAALPLPHDVVGQRGEHRDKDVAQALRHPRGFHRRAHRDEDEACVRKWRWFKWLTNVGEWLDSGEYKISEF